METEPKVEYVTDPEAVKEFGEKMKALISEFDAKGIKIEIFPTAPQIGVNAYKIKV